MKKLYRQLSVILLIVITGNLLVPVFPAQAQPTNSFEDWLVYEDKNCGFSFQYPPESFNMESVFADSQGNPEIRIGFPVTPGTNLKEKFVDITCNTDSETGKLNLQNGGEISKVKINGIDFDLQTGGSGGAGNFYEETKYATQNGNQYIALDFVLHSVSAGTSGLPEFDKAEGDIFAQIISTFQFLSVSPVLPPLDPNVAAQARGQIVFSSCRDGNSEIYVMNANGTNQINLTNNQAGEMEPAWSPDGKRIAFVSNRDGNDEIYVMNADGRGQVNLTNSEADDRSPAWSPDGKRIAFTSYRNDGGGIYILTVNGDGAVTRLAKSIKWSDDATWSPDGKHIIFSAYGEPGRAGGIFSMNVDDNETFIRLTEDYGSVPDLSPDGSQIAFVARYGDGNYREEIFVSQVDGKKSVRLTLNEKGQGGWSRSPSWSPDGKQIAYVDHLAAIYIMNADGTGAARVTDGCNGDPDWSPVVTQVAPKDATITGHVNFVDDNGKEIAVLKGVLVRLVNADGQKIGTEDYTDYTETDGTYSITASIPVGDYLVQAWLEDKNGKRRITVENSTDTVWAGERVQITSDTPSISPTQTNISFGKDVTPSTPSSLSDKARLSKSAYVYDITLKAQEFIMKELGYSQYVAPDMIRLWRGTTYEWAKYVDKNTTDPNLIPYTIEVSSLLSDAVLSRHPMFLWHEEFHHFSWLAIPSMFDKTDFTDSHAGIGNPSTRGGYMEAWAEFWPAVMEPKQDGYYHYGSADGAKLSLDENHKSWDTRLAQMIDPTTGQSVPKTLYMEEFAIAGVFWDLYDSGLNDDNVVLRNSTLFSILTQPTNPPRTMRELYLALKVEIEKKRLFNENSSEVKIEDINAIFIAHGFFDDQNNDTWHQEGETPGWAQDAGRMSPAYLPGAYITLDFLPDNLQNVTAEIQIKDSIDLYSYSYTIEITEQPFDIHLLPPGTNRVAIINISVSQDNQLLGFYSLDNQKYWEWVNTSPQEKSRSITLKTDLKDEPITGFMLLNNSPILQNDAAFFGASVESGGQINYSWGFGDGTTATGQLTNHVYTTPGDYIVTVTASNSLGTVTQTKTITVAKNETISQSPVGWIQENIIWVIVPLIAVGVIGFLAIFFIFMKRRNFAFATIGAKPRKPFSKQTAPTNRISAVSTPPIHKPVAASEQQIKTAKELAKAGKFQESFVILKEVVAVEPNNAQAWLFLGANLMNLNDYVNAEKCLQRAKQLGDPKADQALEWLKTKRDGIQ